MIFSNNSVKVIRSFLKIASFTEISSLTTFSSIKADPTFFIRLQTLALLDSLPTPRFKIS